LEDEVNMAPVHELCFPMYLMKAGVDLAPTHMEMLDVAQKTWAT
jgi:hypothetical protein